MREGKQVPFPCAFFFRCRKEGQIFLPEGTYWECFSVFLYNDHSSRKPNLQHGESKADPTHVTSGECDDYWLYDIKCAYLKYWSTFPEVIGYEDLQDEFDTQYWFIKVKKISWIEEEDWEHIYKHFENRFKEQEIEFIRF